MTTEITVNGTKRLVDKDELWELANQNENVQLNIDEWTIQTRHELKIYDADAFITHANKYYSEAPPDLIQTASKLWLACVYTVKKFYLDINVHLTSHNSMKFFVELACDFGSAPVKLFKAWKTAEKLHSYSYDSKSIAKKEFPDLISQIEWFVKEFPTIPKDKVNHVISELDFESVSCVTYVYDKGAKTVLSGNKYNAENRFY